MIMDDGVFHADPHPGNLAVTDDGRIVFYDFGMSGRVDPFVQEKIIEFYVAVANQDIDAILDALIEIGTLQPGRRSGRDGRGDGDRDPGRPRGKTSSSTASIRSSARSRTRSTCSPSDCRRILRSSSGSRPSSGVCVTLDEDFDFISTATDYLTEEGIARVHPAVHRRDGPTTPPVRRSR